jgi:hypothetical protein
MTAATVAPGEEALATAITSFLVGALGLTAGLTVLQGYPNFTPPPPAGQPGYVVFTNWTRARLRTNIDTFDFTAENPTTMTAEKGTQVMVQIDCFGPNAEDWADIVSTLWRDPYGCQALANGQTPPTCQPLHADDGTNTTFVNAEQNYEPRWTVTAYLQYNAVVTVPQQYADTLGPVEVVNVEAEYPN